MDRSTCYHVNNKNKYLYLLSISNRILFLCTRLNLSTLCYICTDCFTWDHEWYVMSVCIIIVKHTNTKINIRNLKYFCMSIAFISSCKTIFYPPPPFSRDWKKVHACFNVSDNFVFYFCILKYKQGVLGRPRVWMNYQKRLAWGDEHACQSPTNSNTRPY